MTPFSEPFELADTEKSKAVHPIRPYRQATPVYPQDADKIIFTNQDKQATTLPAFVAGDYYPIDKLKTWRLPTTSVAQNVRPSSQSEEKATNYGSTLRNLLQSSGIYALASFVSPLISLVLAPFLTSHLLKADYGALAVFTTAIALLSGITQVGLNNAFFRAYNCDYENEKDRLRIVSTLISLLLLITTPVTLVLIITSPWVSSTLFGETTFSDQVKLAALAVLLQNLTVPGFSWLRAENRATYFATLSILNLLVSLGSNLLLVGVLHTGLTGALIAVCCGYGVIDLLTLPMVLWRAGLRIRKDIAHNLLSFGVPLVGGFVSIWILQLSDRYLLSRLGSLSQTGSYAVAYTLGNVMGAVVLAPFSLAWPTAMFSIAKRDDAARVFKLIFRWYSIGLLFITFIFSLVSTGVLYLFFPPAYHSAASIIPIIATSIMFYGIYDIFCIGIGITRKTWYAVILTGIAATVNIVANLFLIPLYGSMGAAFATLIAYLLLAIITYFINQHIYPIPFEMGKFALALGIGIAFFTGSNILAQAQNVIVQATIYSGALCLYGICLILIGNPFVWLKAFLQKRERTV